MTVVHSVAGPVDSAELGVCLPHEHIINDVRSWWSETTQPGVDPTEFRDAPVSEQILWELRQDPFGNLDNCVMDSYDTAIAELSVFKDLGGTSVLEATSMSIGRDLEGLRKISEATGLTIVAGTGMYLDASMSDDERALSIDEIAEILRTDLAGDDSGLRPGFIGEIGVSSDFTDAEHKSLRAASRVQKETGLPMQVHLPGWFRLGHQVLDLCEEEGVSPSCVVLCHMGPSGEDTEYQKALAARGVWIQYDMVGMEVFYADQGVQCPSDEDNARYLMGLVDAGYADQLLISQDIFLKSLQRGHGGPGYGHIQQYFLPRLGRHGASDELTHQLTVTNPRMLFETAKEKHNG
jgi:phosphotriesterase-related protein